MNFVRGGSTMDKQEDDQDFDSVRPGLGMGKIEEEEEEAAAGEEEEEEEEEEESPGPEDEVEDEFAHVRLPMSFGGPRRRGRGEDGSSQPEEGEEEEEEAAEGATPSTTQWGSSYGPRLLAKMGWTGGGIKTSMGEGIDRPIEVRLRGRDGLGFKGSEKTQQQIEMEMKRAGALSDKKTATAKKKKKKKTAAKETKREPAWKKKPGVNDAEAEQAPSLSKGKKGKRVYKTVEEVLSSQKTEKQLILDMTQAQPRVLTDMKQAVKGTVDARAKGEAGRQGVGMPAPELKHNIKFFVDMKEMELQNIDRRIRQEESTKEKLKRQEERLQKQVDARADQMRRLKTIMEIIEKCNERIKANNMPLETLEKVFDMFRNKYAREYEVYKLSSLAYSLIGPLVKSKMESWHPLKDPGLLVELVTTWRKILRQEDEENGTEDEERRDNISEGILRRKGPRSTAPDTYNRMIVDMVLPVIRRVVINEWNPRDFESGIRLMRLWAPPVLTHEAYENIMMHFIFPKISREVR